MNFRCPGGSPKQAPHHSKLENGLDKGKVDAEALNMKLVSHEPLNGFGNMGEGISLQVTVDAASSGSRTRARRKTSPASM